MDQHRGMRRDRCPRCQAMVNVTYWPDATSDQLIWVRVERRLPGQMLGQGRRVEFWVQLAAEPNEAVSRAITRFLFSADPEHELTLAEALAGVPRLLGESVHQIIEGLGELSADCPDCKQRLGLVADLFAALMIMLTAQLVAPLLAFLEWVTVIGALLPGGDIDQAATLLIRHWTRDIIGTGLGDYLERWTGIISAYSTGRLVTVISREVELHPRPSATRPRVTDAAETPVARASKERQDRFAPLPGHRRPRPSRSTEPPRGPIQSPAAQRPPHRPRNRPTSQRGFDYPGRGFDAFDR